MWEALLDVILICLGLFLFCFTEYVAFHLLGLIIFLYTGLVVLFLLFLQLKLFLMLCSKIQKMMMDSIYC